ncbi:hypothetical protein BJX63DRAFT_393351 [Aspergillus granulosus]|uniref:Aminoglycoside phosphotransferase domain-containing protein n=1 Tax=Aspergillus granulosus TaxID=176169 RepID=A0ABR4HEY2_9EURO
MDPILRQGELTGKTIPVLYAHWLLGDRLACKTRVHYDYSSDDAGETYDQHEVYEATLADKEPEADKLHKPPLQVGMPAIIKVKTQLEHWSNEPDCGKCSDEIWREINNLKALTDAGCEHTPKLIDWGITHQSRDETLPGGYFAFIVMEKLPGKDLSDFDEMKKSEQHRVQLAFLEAIWNFTKCKFTHWDPRLPNLIWDPDKQKCYIVDLEDAEHNPEQAAEGFSIDSWNTLRAWQLVRGSDRKWMPIYSKEKLVQYWKKRIGMSPVRRNPKPRPPWRP